MAQPKLPTPRRSVLYRLGVDAGAYESAASHHPDVLLFEIEDSVPPGDKETAQTGALTGADAGGGAANVQQLLPRHKGAVQRFFKREN